VHHAPNTGPQLAIVASATHPTSEKKATAIVLVLGLVPGAQEYFSPLKFPHVHAAAVPGHITEAYPLCPPLETLRETFHCARRRNGAGRLFVHQLARALIDCLIGAAVFQPVVGLQGVRPNRGPVCHVLVEDLRLVLFPTVVHRHRDNTTCATTGDQVKLHTANLDQPVAGISWALKASTSSPLEATPDPFPLGRERLVNDDDEARIT
jgi:hypothetical protein